MKCFDVVHKVLAATYGEIKGDDATKEAAVKAALDATSEHYKEKLLSEGGPSFADPIVRFAYVFRYVPSHAHWLYELITMSPDAEAVFEKDRLRVTCLGGGPGSDLVGVLKFIASTGKKTSLFCEIVDGCIQWKHTWADLAFTLDLESMQTMLHTDYVIHDVADEKTWDAPCAFSKADVFTVSFFASEITRLGATAEKYLERALAAAKPGAIVLMNDNNNAKFYGWFDNVSANAGFDVLVKGEGDRRIYDKGEQIAALGDFATKFGATPRLTGNLSWRMLRKKG